MKNLTQALTAGFGATLAILILAYLREYYGIDLWLMAPFGATTVLVFGLPTSPLAQPKNVIFGHLITSVIGLVFVHFVGTEYWALALATGMGVFAMLATKTTHPPAGANPILIMLVHPNWSFLINPVLLGAVAIVFVGLVYQKFIQGIMTPSN
ncbi:HPP family protein [Vibrio sp. F74]|uniref:HPP family protein n=1 Tax=Vibrio sp. F74 TaxID=700020 RepID=UPI0035F5CB28